MPSSYDKYNSNKKLSWCDYPFEPCGLGYCWGFATRVDKGKGSEKDMKKFCEGCECNQKRTKKKTEPDAFCSKCEKMVKTIRQGRAHLVCEVCKEDVTLSAVFLEDAKKQ